MTFENGPFCVHCGRPTRFNMNGQYVCKQGCDVAAAQAAEAQKADALLKQAESAVSAAGRRITVPAPEPPSLTGPVDDVLQALENNPDLEQNVPTVTEEEQAAAAESEEGPTPEPAPEPPKPARKRGRWSR